MFFVYILLNCFCLLFSLAWPCTFGSQLNPYIFTECSVSSETSIMVAQPFIQVCIYKQIAADFCLHFLEWVCLHFSAAGFGIPGLVVGLTMGVSGSTYRHSAFCWLSYNNSSVWGMLGPEVICAVVHMVTMLLNLRTVFRYKRFFYFCLPTCCMYAVVDRSG